MLSFQGIAEYVERFIPLGVVVTVVALGLWGVNWYLLVHPKGLESDQRFYRQLVMLGLTLLGLLAVALSLPVDEHMRNRVVGLFGILLSGAIALSSTTIIANLMAGLMMRVTKPFRTGDFIRVAEDFGRVTERGLLDTEIQTEARELVALPNAYLIAKPLSVIRSSGAMVAVTLSLGYDLHHARIEGLLVAAAKECGLKDPFVQILQLGDFSVSYRVSGLLEEVKGLLTARSNLSRCVLDSLHENGVEIVSPSFMNQRRMEPNARMIPPVANAREDASVKSAEEIVFDKAEAAENIEKQKAELLQKLEEREAALKAVADDGKEALTAEISLIRGQLETMGKPAANSTQPSD